MTTNIAALSLLTGWSARSSRRSLSLIVFILGYAGVYVLLAVSLSMGFFLRSSVSYFLQNSIGVLLGPVLILSGMILTELLPLNPVYKGRMLSRLQQRKWSGIYALPMGALLALSFCPATAALFFGILIPLAVDTEKIILFPLLYALGASIPLAGTAALITRGARIKLNPVWQKRISLTTGVILIIIGVILTLQRIYL